MVLDRVVAYAEANGTTPLPGEVAYVLGSPERLDAALGELSGRLGHAGSARAEPAKACCDAQLGSVTRYTQTTLRHCGNFKCPPCQPSY
ncbi:hypothetical protein [Streptomyces chiangmaiensis]|uniref:hypothetical protein n=1 Tax=Streptomyces chiangmaiensis TaxID=766497 RepID=UPI003372C44A